MPVIICPHCDERQTVSRDLAGLTAACTGCGEGIRIPLAAPKPPKSASNPKVVIDEPEVSGTDLRKTVLLLGGLIVGVLLVLAVLLYAVTPSRKVTPPAPVASVPAFPERDPVRDRTPTRDDASADWTTGLMSRGELRLSLVMLLAFVYVIVILIAGAALTRDAAARGLPPLPWAAAYFLAHAVGPALGAVVATPLIVVLPSLGVVAGLVLSLVGGWYGALMYLAVRRPGYKAPCPRCRNSRLKYLVTCPHCGQTEAAGEPRA